MYISDSSNILFSSRPANLSRQGIVLTLRIASHGWGVLKWTARSSFLCTLYLGTDHIITIFHNMAGWASHGNPLSCSVRHGEVMLGLIREGLFSASDLAQQSWLNRSGKNFKGEALCVSKSVEYFVKGRKIRAKHSKTSAEATRLWSRQSFLSKRSVQWLNAVHLQFPGQQWSLYYISNTED